MPQVSVIIPTFNRAHFIKETLESVLAQTYTDYEVIVIDDGSTDDTENVVSAFLENYPQIRYIKQANAGVSAARNHGIFEARGEWIAFLDSDDLWFPDKLEKQMAFLAEHPTAGAVCCPAYDYQDGHILCSETSQPVLTMKTHVTAILPFDLFTQCNHALTSTILIKKSVLYKAGLFEGGLNIGEDFDFWVRVARYTEFWHFNEVAVYYRKHSDNISGVRDHVLFFDGFAREIQYVRWSGEPEIVKQYGEWLAGYSDWQAAIARERRDYKETARFFWKAMQYAPHWKGKGKYFAKYVIAKCFPFIYHLWDRRKR